MLFRFLPIYNAFKRKISSVKSIDDICDSKEILCQAEQSKVKGVAIDDYCRALITSTNKPDNLELEQRRMEGYLANHQETVKYKFNNVLATPTGFHVFDATFSGNGSDVFGPILENNIPIIEKGFYATSYVTSKYFGHWLCDGVPTSLLKEPDEELYLWSPSSWGHTSDYLDLLGIERVNATYVFFKQMSYCKDIGMNSNRRQRIKKIKKELMNKGTGIEKVYLSRGDSGVLRKIVNEDELTDALHNLGFHIASVYDPLDDIIDSCAGAKVTVSIEGSNVAHLMMCAAFGADHIIINPADKFSGIFADYASAVGDNVHSIVAVKEKDGYKVDIPRLVKVIKAL